MPRPSPRRLVLPVLLAVLALGAPAPAGAGEPRLLPHDDSLVHGTLPNGLAYVLKRHGNPEEKISLWLHVSSGSLNETEEQRGLAHYLEHLAFNGSKNFPPGSVVPFFESLGLTFGRDQNAFTSFDQTTYQLALPDTKPETVDQGLLFLSDVAFRLSLLPAEIDEERQVILEEKRTRLGAEQRVEEYVFERIAPESTLGRRRPIGTEERILAVQEPDFRAYYETWYVPSNMTVIAVGDCDMEPVARAIEKAFADGPTREKPTPRDAGVKPSAEARAIVATDPELQAASVSFVRLEASRPPVTTYADRRRDLVEEIGAWILNRRMGNALAEGKVSFLSARASRNEMARMALLTTVEASGRPERWRAMVQDVALAVQQARVHGFTEREVADARTDLLADADRAVGSEPTAPARRVLMRLNRAITSGEPVLSAEQRKQVLAELLPGITAEHVSAAFRANFDFAKSTVILQIPAGEGVPTEDQVVQAGREALAVEPPKPTEAARATTLLEKAVEPGTVAERTVHEASGVTSAWLGNGVRLHHLENTQRKNAVTVTVTLAGGEIEETEANVGVTKAALLAWNRPATSRLPSTQVRDLMTGKKVRVQGAAQEDTVTLTVEGDPADLETGLQLAWLLLTDPVVEAAALEQWKQEQVESIRGSKQDPRGVLMDAMARTFYPGVPGALPLEEAVVARITREAAHAWIRRLAAQAPVEVAVVGDLPRERAEALAARYLGSLPQRARIGRDTLAGRRKVDRPKGPLVVRRSVPTKTPQAFVLDGFFGANHEDVMDVRRLNLASRILSTRMVTEIREAKQLVYSIGAGSRPSEAYPGFGLFVAQAPTDPAKAEALGEAIEATYAAFAKEGPTAEELTVAKKQTANAIGELMKAPEFWATRLADLDYRGVSLDDVMGMAAAYQAMTAEEIRETFARYLKPESRFRFVVVPAP